MFDLNEWQERNPLRVWRKARKMTQSAAAASIGVGVQVLQRWEAGASMPSDESFDKIAKLMDQYDAVSMAKLLETWRSWRAEPAAEIGG